MDYRGYWITKISGNWGTFYRAGYTPKGKRLARYVAAHVDPVGIMRAVDDYIATGRKVYDLTA